jgi:hypothetical protein
MTKKDYVKFAKMIAEQTVRSKPPYAIMGQYVEGYSDCTADFKVAIMAIFLSDNLSFDASRFSQFIDSQVKSILDSVQ